MNRRLLPLLALCLAAGAALAAGQPSSQAPIKVGFLGPLSGPYVQNGRDILNGFLLALDEMGHRAGGRPIELIVEDDEAIPAVGLTKARKLIERDHVQLMTGALLSSTGYALAPYIDSMKVPMIYPVVSADDLTQRRPSRWIIRTGWTGSQPNHAFGEYAYRTLKQEGVVETRRGLGMFVAATPPRDARQKPAVVARQIAERALREAFRHGLLGSDLRKALDEISPKG